MSDAPSLSVPLSMARRGTLCALLIACMIGGCGGGEPTRSNPPTSNPPPSPTPPPPAPPESGLDARPSNVTCLAWPGSGFGSVRLERFTQLDFGSAVGLLQAPHDDAAWYVVEQGGVVRRFAGATATSATTVIDLTDRVVAGGEMGLLGMAFHPSFPTDPRVFLSYTAVEGTQRVSRVSAFVSADAGVTLNPASETILLTVHQPAANHNGGHIAFGPDGFLYIGLGDGGGGGDPWGPNGNGQRLTTLLGKMLRVDVNAGAPYAIPPDNPFSANPLCGPTGRDALECPEIYAWGFRNPWRFSFDRATGELWVGDVGQGDWEEVSLVERGGNYGWRCREGAHDFNTAGTPACAGAALIDPIVEYPNAGPDVAVTGGYVYRGSQPTPLHGRYIFADFGSGVIRVWIPEGASAPRAPTPILESGVNIPSFGEGNDGELYITSFDALYRIAFQPPTGGDAAPALLSETGCVNPADARQAAQGLIPYEINAPFWSDGAVKQRWLALPDGARITIGANGDWDFPIGSVLMKTFAIGSRLVETRLLMRRADGWGGVSYAWNDQQTDATLVRGGAVRDIDSQQWIFPSEAECSACHTVAAGGALGLETAQLNRALTYPQTGRTANQLSTLSHIQALTPPITNPETQDALADPADADAALDERARAYLHTNCAQCHRPNGPTPSSMDLRYTTALSATGACDVPPQNGDLGLGESARLIAPGDAARSILVHRMQRRDANGMPPLASTIVDDAGVALLTEWINGMSGC